MVVGSDKVEIHLYLESYKNRIALRQIALDINIQLQEAYFQMYRTKHLQSLAHLLMKSQQAAQLNT